jgi:hypothetical protein
MKTHSLVAAAILLSAISALAQQAKPVLVAEGGGSDDRASARVVYWNLKKNADAGQFAIDYGRPVWKSVYEDAAQFDAMTKGKVWRMGSNFWTVLDTSLPLKVSGREVPVGSYYLGLHRAADGSTWSLAFIDPGKIRAAHLDAFNIQQAPVEFEVPVSIAKTETKADKLTITLSYPKENIRKVTLKLEWGNLALTAPIDVTVSD